MAVAVSRIDALARPKPLPPGFMEDRRSVYWIDRQPLTSRSETPPVAPRLTDLARHKTVHRTYMGDRPTSIWPVSPSAKNFAGSERIDNLACARFVHKDYKYERSVYHPVPESARNARATPRLEQLSTPKPHMTWSNNRDSYTETEFSQPIWPVSERARVSACSGRVETLSGAKYTHSMYLGERQVQWPVTDNAMNAVATLRMQQLAQPKCGRFKKDDYDPYKVTMAAYQARATPRIEEMSMPLPRKIRQKKIG